MRVFVAGGTGVVGLPLVDALVDRGHEVVASTRRTGNLRLLKALGARPVLMDGLDDVSVRRTVLEARPEVIVNLMTALADSATDYGAWLAVTNRLRSEGTKTLMDAARDAGCRRVVAQSASFMTELGTGPTDETTPLYLDGPGPIGDHVRSNLAAEQLVLGTPGVEGVVLRYGFLYGHGTSIGTGGDIVTAVTAGEMPIVGEGVGRYPFIYVNDAAEATVQAVEKDAEGIYNVVDDDPARQAEWLPYLAELLGGPDPGQVSEDEAAAAFGVQSVYYGNRLRPASNARAKAELEMKLAYPSWRQGFQELFG